MAKNKRRKKKFKQLNTVIPTKFVVIPRFGVKLPSEKLLHDLVEPKEFKLDFEQVLKGKKTLKEATDDAYSIAEKYRKLQVTTFGVEESDFYLIHRGKLTSKRVNNFSKTN